MSETKIPVLGGCVLEGLGGGEGNPPDEISMLYVRQKGRAWRKEQASSPRAAGRCGDPGCPEPSPLAGQQFPPARPSRGRRTGRPGDVGGLGARGRGAFTTAAAPAGTKMALKFVNKSKTKLKNFLREVSITNSLSSSPFIIKVFDVVFETEDCYVFAQEYAPAGDLFDIIPPQVLGAVAQGQERVPESQDRRSQAPRGHQQEGGSLSSSTPPRQLHGSSGDMRGRTRQPGSQGLPGGGALAWGGRVPGGLQALGSALGGASGESAPVPRGRAARSRRALGPCKGSGAVAAPGNW